MRRLVRSTVALAALAMLSSCGAGSEQAELFPFPTSTAPQSAAQPQQPAVTPQVVPPLVAPSDSTSADDDAAPNTLTTPADFCSAWQQMTTAGYRYASQYIAVGADELIATSNAARQLLPDNAPAFQTQQIEMFAYQGEAGLLARDLEGAALASFQRDIDQKFRDDSLVLPAQVQDFLWISEYCPNLPDPKRYFEPAADLVVSEPIIIATPPGGGEVTLSNHPITFQGDPALPNAAQGPGYVGRRFEPDGTSSALTITRQSDVYPDEWAFGECSFNGDPDRWATEQDRVLYLETTDHGTTIVVTFRPQLSDLSPAVFSLSLVSTPQAPTELGQAGFCDGDLAVWDTADRSRFVVTGEFFDATPRDTSDVGFPRAFHSVDELIAAPGGPELLHALRTMTFGFLEST